MLRTLVAVSLLLGAAACAESDNEATPTCPVLVKTAIRYTVATQATVTKEHLALPSARDTCMAGSGRTPFGKYFNCALLLHPVPGLQPAIADGPALNRQQCTTLIGDQADAARKAMEVPTD
jgi:hypothetical protein